MSSRSTPLTTANALDVWHAPGAGNLTSADVIRSLSSMNNTQIIVNSTNQLRCGPAGRCSTASRHGAHGAGRQSFIFGILKDAVEQPQYVSSVGTRCGVTTITGW